MKPGPKPNNYASQEWDYATNYTQEYSKCSKPTCSTCRDGQGHGPYWYSYHYSPTLKRRVRKYIGKDLDRALPPAPSPPQPPANRDNYYTSNKQTEHRED
jgi:hypothetical protein